MSGDERKLNEAVAWHVRLNSGDANEIAWDEFAIWLEADAENRAAYDRVEDTYDAIPNVSIPDPLLRQFQRPASARQGSVWVTGAALLAAAIILAIGVESRMGQPASIHYATGTGQTETIALVDGSAITLNTHTAIDVAVDHDNRTVTIEDGEVLFHVAKDPSHPFIVTAGDRSIRVVGTVFDVLRDSGAVTVVVAEGKVTVSQRGTSSGIVLAPGQRAKGREGDAQEVVQLVNPAHALAWRDGYLVYDSAPLSTVVDDLNRYYPAHISIAGRDVAARHFSGVIKIGDENAVLGYIAQFLQVRAERTKTGIVLRAAVKPD